MEAAKGKVIEAMHHSGIIPVYYNDDVEKCKVILSASAEAGIRAFEFTNRGKNALQIFSELRKLRDAEFPELYLGIGTIFEPGDALDFISAGADFIVSPVLTLDVAEVCHKNNLPWIPGCATLTEIYQAKKAGADLVKIFPASVLGPGFVSAVKPVIPDVKIMPTGGVVPQWDNLLAWFKAGVHCVGIGSQLFPAGDKQDKEHFVLHIKSALSLAEQVRSTL